MIRGHYPAPEETLQVLAALRLQYLQGDYTLHTTVQDLEEVYPLQKLKSRITQSTKTFTATEKAEKKRASFLEGTLRRSFRSGSVSKQKVEEDQMLDMWVKEEISASRTSIIDKWKKLQRMNQEQAMAKYMALIKEWPGYGSTLFDVEVSKIFRTLKIQLILYGSWFHDGGEIINTISQHSDSWYNKMLCIKSILQLACIVAI